MLRKYLNLVIVSVLLVLQGTLVPVALVPHPRAARS